jgi:drug/metabolite transporter (DMT)-like permease
MRNQGAQLALISAALFGLSPVLAKGIIGNMSPALLAGLLYLGSGIGLHAALVLQRQSLFRQLTQLSKKNFVTLLGVIVCGGILAPLCLAYGIKWASAFEVSLLLNFEAVATTLLAFFLFHEHVSLRVWIGKVFVVMGAAIVVTYGTSRFSIAGFFVIAACILWGLDNNLTRNIEDLPATSLACIKGWVAGIFNTLLALFLGNEPVAPLHTLYCLLIGAISYGLSLVLFVKALRQIGSARTSTYFASGPFFGMIFAVLLLGEQPSLLNGVAACLMALGVVILYRESHSHLHIHEAMTHGHLHTHDEHHQHPHDGTEGPEPHDHAHSHEPVGHAHSHLPDIHHRHRH